MLTAVLSSRATYTVLLIANMGLVNFLDGQHTKYIKWNWLREQKKEEKTIKTKGIKLKTHTVASKSTGTTRPVVFMIKR